MGIASAAYPDNANPLSSNKVWVVANGQDNAQISFIATNNSYPLKDLTVEFSLNNTNMGSISPATAITGTDGIARSTFTTSTKSGTVNITAKIFFRNNESDSSEPLKNSSYSILQQIDHSTPVKLFKIGPDINGSEVNVGSSVQIIYQLKDQFDNNIDERKKPISSNETIKFKIDNKPGAIFNGTWMGQSYHAQEVTLQVNGTGFIVANLTTDSVPGINTIHIIPQSGIPDSSFDIRGVAKGEPYSITQSVYIKGNATPVIINPDDPPRLPADGISQFTFIYNIKDRFGNGIIGTPVRINVTIAGEITKLTDNYGEVIVYIGPTDKIGPVNISAFTTNESVKKTNQTVRFVSTEPDDMQLTADPQSMPSRDVRPDYSAKIIAKVIDESGNPNEGIPVTFNMTGVTYDEIYHVVTSPILAQNSAVTNGDGEAIVQFYPGAFTTNYYDKDPAHPYDATATGYCYINARWNDTVRSIPLTWKNYPYLSVQTSVNSKVVNVTDTIDVTLTLQGDGYALQPKPIDVIIIIDRSGSMQDNNKMAYAKTAAKSFVNKMNVSRDRVGLVSYGSTTSLDKSLTNDFASVKTKITNLNADGATQMRNGLYKAIKNVKDNGRDTSVKAVILMTDGNWNYDGTPLGLGNGFSSADTTLNNSIATWPGTPSNFDSYKYYPELGGGTYQNTLVAVPDSQHNSTTPRYQNFVSEHYENASSSNQNMSVYASENGIRIYTISFAGGTVEECIDGLKTLATTTNGSYEDAPTGEDLTNIYTKIAGELKDLAGVDTQMDIDMGTVEINGNVTNNDVANQVLNYQYVPDISTKIVRLWTNGTQITVPIPNPDQTETYWDINRTLHFNIGTMHLGEVYKATYRLQVMRDGNINLFGPGSKIKFLNGISGF